MGWADGVSDLIEEKLPAIKGEITDVVIITRTTFDFFFDEIFITDFSQAMMRDGKIIKLKF